MMKRRFFVTVEALASAVREERQKTGLSQEELALAAEVSEVLVKALECAEELYDVKGTLSVLNALGVHAVVLPPVEAKSADGIDLSTVVDRFR